MLFVSVQQNNIDLCIQYAINEYVVFPYCRRDLITTFFSLIDKIGVISIVCPRHPNMTVRLNSIQEDMNMAYNAMVWAFICEWKLNSLNWVFTFYGIVTSKCQHTICKYAIFENCRLLISISETCQWKLMRKRAMWIQLMYDLNLCYLILTCGSECEYNLVEWLQKLSLWNTGSMYVACLGVNYWNLISVFWRTNR